MANRMWKNRYLWRHLKKIWGKIVYYIHISLRVEVTLFVPSPEIEDRNAVEVDNWAKLP
jgi:hypothetical protein